MRMRLPRRTGLIHRVGSAMNMTPETAAEADNLYTGAASRCPRLNQSAERHCVARCRHDSVYSTGEANLDGDKTRDPRSSAPGDRSGELVG